LEEPTYTRDNPNIVLEKRKTNVDFMDIYHPVGSVLWNIAGGLGPGWIDEIQVFISSMASGERFTIRRLHTAWVRAHCFSPSMLSCGLWGFVQSVREPEVHR
jgi:hypothetical protein